jgi:hypothetical protein
MRAEIRAGLSLGFRQALPAPFLPVVSAGTDLSLETFRAALSIGRRRTLCTRALTAPKRKLKVVPAVGSERPELLLPLARPAQLEAVPRFALRPRDCAGLGLGPVYITCAHHLDVDCRIS